MEVDVDTSAYEQGHIAGAVGLNWQTQLCDQVRRDILTKDQFEELCSNSGIDNDTTIIFYGDNKTGSRLMRFGSSAIMDTMKAS